MTDSQQERWVAHREAVHADTLGAHYEPPHYITDAADLIDLHTLVAGNCKCTEFPLHMTHGEHLADVMHKAGLLREDNYQLRQSDALAHGRRLPFTTGGAA